MCIRDSLGTRALDADPRSVSPLASRPVGARCWRAGLGHVRRRDRGVGVVEQRLAVHPHRAKERKKANIMHVRETEGGDGAAPMSDTQPRSRQACQHSVARKKKQKQGFQSLKKDNIQVQIVVVPAAALVLVVEGEGSEAPGLVERKLGGGCGDPASRVRK
eukprot:2831585-Rhodomonas_salina.3